MKHLKLWQKLLLIGGYILGFASLCHTAHVHMTCDGQVVAAVGRYVCVGV